LTVYRICNAKHSRNDGEGARLNGGRWNPKGTPILYCAATASLCALEVLANSAGLPAGMVVIAADVPDTLAIEALKETDLPVDWNSPIAPRSTKAIGARWAKNKATVVLSVPSAVVPQERNFLLNPKHPDFSSIKFRAPMPFRFDPRLK
jgi:RES domain-containing protein